MLVKPLVRPIVRAIAGDPTATLGSGWSPTSLFSGGQQGYVYDLDDLSTVYLDSAGTTAASVNGLVGLVLDKSKGLALGAEMLNGTGSASGTWAYSSDVITRNGSTTGLAQSSVSAIAGKTYLIRFTVSNLSGDTFFVRCGGAASGNITANGSYTLRLTATSTSSVFQASPWAGSAGEATISAISVKELAGNHRYQTTTGSKPILRGSPAGGNLVTNGDFASGTGWTTGAGWAIGSGVATATAASAPITSDTMTPVAGKVYRITYTITASAGSIGISIGGVFGATRTAGGTYVEYLTPSGTTPNLRFTTTGFSGTVDNVEVVDVSAGSVVAPYSLQYDGVDDFLLTASVDFTATDKMTVCHGVRTLASASTAILVELGPSVGGNPGTFYISMPEGSNNIGHRFRGSLAGGTGTVAGYTAPYTQVISLLGDIAGDVNTLRANAVQVGTSATDQGSGNLSNYALYFGRRAGTSLPYNGLEYSSICVGKTASASELASIERWVNSKTKAY